MAKKNCQMSLKKAYLAFDYKHVIWSLPLSNLWHPALPNTSSCSAGGNLWHLDVQTGVRTLGGRCWDGIGTWKYKYIRPLVGNRWQESINIFVHQ